MSSSLAEQVVFGEIDPTDGADLCAARLDQILGLGGGAAGTGHIAAGTEIIMLPQTLRAHVNLVDFAMDHRHVPVANVATAPDPSRCVLRFSRGPEGSSRRLESTRVEKNANGCSQGAQRHAACTQDEKIRVWMLTQRGGQHDESDAGSQRSDGDQPVADS
jgi:hypothetical protein